MTREQYREAITRVTRRVALERWLQRLLGREAEDATTTGAQQVATQRKDISKKRDLVE